jgi:polyphosphate kinase 2 (PPK2 family)
VLEGWDTAGKGGVVRRLGWALDPRSFKVHPISAPDQHERAALRPAILD